MKTGPNPPLLLKSPTLCVFLSVFRLLKQKQWFPWFTVSNFLGKAPSLDYVLCLGALLLNPCVTATGQSDIFSLEFLICPAANQRVPGPITSPILNGLVNTWTLAGSAGRTLPQR